MKHLAALRGYFWKYKLRLSIGVIFILISNYFGVLAPQLTGFVIDFVQRTLHLEGYSSRKSAADYDILVQKIIQVLEQRSYSVTTVVAISGIIILILALLRGLFLFFMRQTIIVMSRHIEYDQKNEVYAHYQQLDLNFYKQHSVGDLMSRIAEDVSRVRMFTGPAIMYLINLLALISLTVYFMYRRSPELTFYVLAPLPVLAITIYLVNTVIHRKSETLQASLAAITVDAQQSYSGIRVIKSFVQESAMLRFFTANSERYRKDAVTLAKIEALYFPSMSLFIGLSTLLTIMIGGLQYVKGAGGIGLDTIVEFVIYINMLTFPVSAIGWTASMIQRAAASQKRLNEFLLTQPAILNPPSPIEADTSGPIVFDHVDFVYPNTGIQALHDFSLTIQPGERVAVVGRTGSGKTTLVQLLLRLYDVTAGTLSVGGTDVRQVDLSSLRSGIGYVPQDGFLFSDSVARNIAFGAPAAQPEAVTKAALMAVVHNDITGFPEGYETVVGERGVTLSGGQKQRLAIARALIRNTPVVILDDSLSAVDSKTEAEILGHIETYMKGRTAILITHKVSALQAFDRIVVLEAGRIAETGTHSQLLAHKGLYYEMYLRQQVKGQSD